MPILDNPKHECFSQALARGVPASLAYIEAGYCAHESNSARLSGNERVKGRVGELQTAAAQTTAVTIVTITAELDEAARFAKATGAPAALVAAIMGKAKIAGLLIDKSEVRGLDIAATLQRARRRVGLPGADGFGGV